MQGKALRLCRGSLSAEEQSPSCIRILMAFCTHGGIAESNPAFMWAVKKALMDLLLSYSYDSSNESRGQVDVLLACEQAASQWDGPRLTDTLWVTALHMNCVSAPKFTPGQLSIPKGGVTAAETALPGRALSFCTPGLRSEWGDRWRFPQSAFGWQWRYTKATSHCVRADKRLIHGWEKHFLCNSEAQSLWAVLWAFRGLQRALRGEKRTSGYTTMLTLCI